MKKASYFLMLCILLASCGVLKNGVSYFGEQRIFDKVFRFYPTQMRKVIDGEPNFELGIAFVTHKPGRITGIRIKNPQLGNLRLSLWDANTRQLINTFNFANSNPNEYNLNTYQIPLQQGLTYCLTINIRQYYYYTLPHNPLPLHLPEITLLSSVYAEGVYQRFPEFIVTDVVHGLIDLDVEWEI